MPSGRGLTQLFGPGELFWEPTNVSGNTGTGLGYTKSGIRLSPNFAASKIRADEKGVELLKEIFAGCDFVLTAMLIQWDANVVARLFPGLNPSGARMDYGNSVLKGSALPQGKLLWVPEDTVNVPAIYFRKASAHIEASAEIAYALGDNPQPAMFPIVFTNASAADSAPATTVQVRPLANITL
jgi:hypothetical protein